jgi:DNA-binding Lrp family transcriptional regulator
VIQSVRAGHHFPGLAAAQWSREGRTGHVREAPAEHLSQNRDAERVAELPERAQRAGRHPGSFPRHRGHRGRGQRRHREAGASADKDEAGNHDRPAGAGRDHRLRQPARRADTAWVQILSGDTEVLCALRGDARQERAALLSKLPRSDRIVAVTAHSLLHMFTGGPQGLRSLHVLPESRVEPLRYHVRDGHVELGDLDFALFSALGEDGRTPYADLAASTGWSESTVRRRMEQLRDVGVLYYDLEIDPPAFGFHAVTWLWMSVPPSRLASVGETIAKFPEVGYASATTGPANLAVCAVCRDEAELYEFLTGKVGALPDVTRTETSPVIRTLKQSSATVLPVRP